VNIYLLFFYGVKIIILVMYSETFFIGNCNLQLAVGLLNIGVVLPTDF